MLDDSLHIPGYTIHQQLGRGGMAVVYLATQESLNRKVAIKVLLDSKGNKLNERFINEARFIASLNHPRIITIYDVSTLDNGDHYIAMEYLEYGDLQQCRDEYFSPNKALDVVIQVAEGLASVHEKGIVHRDIKPANILFRRQGEAVVTDFGIAKDVENDSDLTQVGFNLGSPSYSSPEQARSQALDHRSDIYSLGVVLLDLLLGFNPFKGSSHTETSMNHIQMLLPELPEHLVPLAPVLDKMLAKDPSDRFQSCEELLIALAGVKKRVVSVESVPEISIEENNDEDATILSNDVPHEGRQFNLQKIKIFGIPLAALLGVFLIYFLFFYKSEHQIKIDTYLKQAQQHLNLGNLNEPLNDNARYFYHQVLLLDEDNHRALRGLEVIKEKQIELYLANGLSSLEKGQLDEPKHDNAIYYFYKVLAIDENNKSAKQGLSQVTHEFTRLAREAFLNKRYRLGNRYVNKGLALTPKDEVLVELKASYKGKANSFNNFIKRVFK